MSSILSLGPSKTRSLAIKTRVIWVPGIFFLSELQRFGLFLDQFTMSSAPPKDFCKRHPKNPEASPRSLPFCGHPFCCLCLMSNKVLQLASFIQLTIRNGKIYHLVRCMSYLEVRSWISCKLSRNPWKVIKRRMTSNSHHPCMMICPGPLFCRVMSHTKGGRHLKGKRKRRSM